MVMIFAREDQIVYPDQVVQSNVRSAIPIKFPEKGCNMP